MAINLRDLALENLNMSNTDHYLLIKRNSRDEDSIKYVSKNMEKFVSEGKTNEFEDGKTYILKDHDKIVGFIGSKKIKSNGILELWYNIDKNERNNGYATKMLEEVTPYLIENVDGLEDIELKINKYNHPSKKSAENAGYNLYDICDDTINYRYFGSGKIK